MSKIIYSRMRQTLAVVLFAVITTVLVPPAHAATARLNNCLANVAVIKPTQDFTKVEYLSVTHKGIPTFEIEVRDDQDREWEFMCSAISGQIYEMEREVADASHPLFKKNAKVSLKEARKKVLALYPGTLEAIEYEIESNGDATYEFDVVHGDGAEIKVEVDARTGRIIEVHIEEWEIGTEPHERV
jgi:uncharacterized membrane protein YkoI